MHEYFGTLCSKDLSESLEIPLYCYNCAHYTSVSMIITIHRDFQLLRQVMNKPIMNRAFNGLSIVQTPFTI